MRTKSLTKIVVIASGFVLAAGLATGCSSDSDSTSTTSSAAAGQMSSMAEMTESTSAASGLVGSGCAAYAAANPSGPASVNGMSTAPLATAAAANPLLKTLTQAISGKLNPQVNLVDTLNNGQYTVFAPTDDAFAKLPAETVDKLKTDSALLTKILTYHVVSGQLAPDAVAGTHKTVQGTTLTVSGSGNDLKVNNSSSVVCGGVKTANATVYLVDTVLMPEN